MRLLRQLLAMLCVFIAPALVVACSDSPTAPLKVAVDSPRNGFWVCPWGYDGTECISPEYCEDNTTSSGAFCNTLPSCDMGCPGEGGGGYTPSAHYVNITTQGDPYPGPDMGWGSPERINKNGYILKDVYKKPTEFKLDFTCQLGHLHIFRITDGFFNRNNWGVSNLGANGWKANYALVIHPELTHVTAGTPGEDLQWASRIPVTSRLTPVLGNPNEVTGPFSQTGKVQGSFIGIHYF